MNVIIKNLCLISGLFTLSMPLHGMDKLKSWLKKAEQKQQQAPQSRKSHTVPTKRRSSSNSLSSRNLRTHERCPSIPEEGPESGSLILLAARSQESVERKTHERKDSPPEKGHLPSAELEKKLEQENVKLMGPIVVFEKPTEEKAITLQGLPMNRQALIKKVQVITHESDEELVKLYGGQGNSRPAAPRTQTKFERLMKCLCGG